MEWGSEIYVAENTISTVTIFQHRKLRILTLLGLYMLKWKQPAHHKGTLDNANTLLCKALYPRSYCQLRYLRLVMSTTSLLGLNITIFLFFSCQHFHIPLMKPNIHNVRKVNSVFPKWKSLPVLQKTCIKILACAIYT